MKRNLDANCGNCPYWYLNAYPDRDKSANCDTDVGDDESLEYGPCLLHPHVFSHELFGGVENHLSDRPIYWNQPITYACCVCGQHPDFFAVTDR